MDGTAPLPAGRQTGSYPEMSLTGNLQSEIVLLTDAARQKESARWRGLPEPPLCQNDCENRVCGNSPGFAALGDGIKLFERGVNPFD